MLMMKVEALFKEKFIMCGCVHQRSRKLKRRFSGGVALLFGAVACFGNPAGAAELDLSKLQVFASHSISADRSDFQGSTVAGGTIALSDFDIDGDLMARESVVFTRGQVHGRIRAPARRLNQVFGGSSGSPAGTNWSHLSTQLDELDQRVSGADATMEPLITRGQLLGQPLTIVRLTAAPGLDVVDLPADVLSSSGPNQVRLVLSGEAASHLIVRIHGASPTLHNVGFAALGDLTPGQVLFAFPEAQDLVIASSGGAVDHEGEDWGIPGSILAPHARLRLAAVRITGQVFARDIAPIDGLPSGQINRIVHHAGPCDRMVPQSAVLSTLMSVPQIDCQVPEEHSVLQRLD